MPREPIPTWYFALVIVRSEDRFLLIQECKRGQQWSVPGGRVEPGEMFVEAARRETLEESGVPVEIEGVMRIDHTLVKSGGTRLRVIFVARPLDDTPPKSSPDAESLGAAWWSLEEMDNLSLRGEEVRQMCRYVANDGTIYPLSILAFEGAPFERNY